MLVEISNESLGLQIEDLDTSISTSAEPVAVGGEAEGVDDRVGLESVELLSFVEIPEDGVTVLTSRGAERSVGGNSDGVDVASVTSQDELDGAVGEIPDLNSLIPATRNHDGVVGVGGEADAGDPVVVSILDDETADSEGVPQTDGAIAGTRDDLTVIGREGNRENVLGVSNEAASSGSSGEIPQAQGGVPRGRQGVLSIRRDDNILNVVTVSTESLAGITELRLITGKSPDDDGLIARSRQDGVRGERGGGNGSNPSSVAGKLSAQVKRLSSHDVGAN